MVLLIACPMTAGCRTDSTPQNPAPDSFVIDADPATYKPRAEVSWGHPMPLATNVGSQPTLVLSCSLWSLSATQVDQAIKSNVTLAEAKNKGNVVALDWVAKGSSMGTSCEHHATPTTPLASAEYVLQITEKDGLQVAAGQGTLHFRSNSAPRVVRLAFLPVDAWSKPPRLSIRFSEAMEIKATAAAVALFDTVEAKAVPIQYPGTASETTVVTGMTFDLPSNFDFSHKTRVTVQGTAIAGSGKTLDGKYTGTAGSGDWSVDLVPSQNGPATAWVPALSF